MLLRFRAPSSSTLSSTTGRATAAFLILYLIALFAIRRACHRDPSSAFFQPYRAHAPRYSVVRRHEAEHFILAAEHSPPFPNTTATAEPPDVCIGIATVAREGARYFRAAVGSVLDGLDAAERARVHLALFIAQTDPTRHPAHDEPWLDNVADRVLRGYEGVSGEELERVKGWEAERGLFRAKGLFDYAYLLQACANTGAAYVVMLEDDVVALDGWYARMREALRVAEEKTRMMGKESFLYLRLFWTEQFHGWNSEDWPTYLCGSLAVVAAVLTSLLYLRRRFPAALAAPLNNQLVVLVSLVFTPLCIGLFFAAGRTCAAPPSPGVRAMNKFGCCSQGLVFQQRRVPELVEHYRSTGVGFVDMLTEQYADERDEMRWAVVPSVLQHVGARSSKADGGSRSPDFSASESIWNYAFELNDPVRLAEERIARAHGQME
ncbi:hypothetical protein BK809_0004804 [Diplodia seriata]|uniref:Integral membrane protein n=1 Tax=Diplodia seriata TaxID=420778 RepID=A0A1S8B7P6_9PEZI|nr:hypothetical protein BK809_0004804 [Diplodia seriata]